MDHPKWRFSYYVITRFMSFDNFALYLDNSMYRASRYITRRLTAPSVQQIRHRVVIHNNLRRMSDKAQAQNPEILETIPLKADEAKFMKLENIKWKDQEGKEVGRGCSP
jgi:hypothetical protein